MCCTDSRSGALGMTFQYDPEGRLASAVQPATGNGGAYAYDAFGLLSSRTVNQSGSLSTTTLYVYDLKGHVIAETDTTGATRREYIWLDDLPVAVIAGVNSANPTLYFVHADHLGRPARMTDQNQNWVWDVIYSPFGATSYIWTNPATLDLRFPGQWFQLENGLAYNWHRHYDPTIGRYLQADPLGLKALMSDGPSVYAYVGGNPLSKIDPTGEIMLPDEPGGLPPDWTQDPTHKDPNSTKWRSPKGGCLEFAPGQPGEPGWGGRPHWHDCTDKQRRRKHWNPGENCPQPGDEPEQPQENNFTPRPAPKYHIPWWMIFALPIPGNPVYGGF